MVVPPFLILTTACPESASTAAHLSLPALEYGYEMPASVPAGLVRVSLLNQGHDVHEGVLVRFSDSSGSAARYVDSVRADVDFPAFATDFGGPGLTLSGESTAVWLDLTPGHYAVVCWKGNHLRLGMAHDLEVTAATGPRAAPPASNAAIQLSDYTLQVDTTLRTGRQVLHIQNIGTEAHEADIFRLSDSRSVNDYLAWLRSGEIGVPPIVPVSGIGDLAPGRAIWVEVNLPPGRYFLLCQVPAAVDGRGHYEHGMVREFTVS